MNNPCFCPVPEPIEKDGIKICNRCNGINPKEVKPVKVSKSKKKLGVIQPGV